MGIKEDYQKAMELAKEGELEQAQALLITINHPKAEALLEKVNRAIAVRGSQVKPKPPKQKGKNQTGILIVMLIVLGVLSAWFYFQVYLPSQRQAQALRRQFAIEAVCRTVYEDYYFDSDISAEGFIDACEQEAENSILRFETEIDYCMEQTDNGKLEQQLIECLADNGVEFSGAWMLGAD